MNNINQKEKKKWQIALRRYIIEKKTSYKYAPYFGLDIESIRKWIELSFTEEMSWDNFSEQWQFDFIIPIQYFDIEKEEELRICWNFLNLTAAPIKENRQSSFNLLQAKTHFNVLAAKTGLKHISIFIQKITELESITKKESIQEKKISFLLAEKEKVELMSSCDEYELQTLNEGRPISELIAERQLFKKFT